MNPTIDPAEHVPQIVYWTTMNLFAAVSQLVLIPLSLAVPRLRRNVLLLNLEFIFLITCSFGACLIWTGHAMDINPPFGMCLFNASITTFSTPAQAGAALSLVARIWASAMLITKPNSRFFQWLSSTWLLFALPYFEGVPIFIASLVVGGRDRATINRGSPFYCTISNETITDIVLVQGGASLVLALICAGWTASLVVRSNWRVRYVRKHRKSNLALMIRTLVYSCSALVAIGCGIASAFTSFAAPVPDMVLSVTGPAVFFIFASDKDILCMLFHCRRPEESILGGSSGAPGSIVIKRSMHVTSDGGPSHELVGLPPTHKVDIESGAPHVLKSSLTDDNNDPKKHSFIDVSTPRSVTDEVWGGRQYK